MRDVCSGFWGFRQDSVNKFAIMSDGFTLEADFFLNTVKHKCSFLEFPISYGARVEGSEAKLRIFDGFRIAWFLVKRWFV